MQCLPQLPQLLGGLLDFLRSGHVSVDLTPKFGSRKEETVDCKNR
jgi:hypothetical protein